MWKRLLNLINSIATNRIGLILLVAHLALFAYAIIEKLHNPAQGKDLSWEEFNKEAQSSTLIAGRLFHWAYESVVLQILMVIDMPVLLIAALTAMVFPRGICSSLSAYTVSWIAVWVWLFCGSLQWLIIGYWIKRYLQIRKEL
jgi:hypothetical protein